MDDFPLNGIFNSTYLMLAVLVLGIEANVEIFYKILVNIT